VRALSADIADLLTPEAMRRLLGGSLLRVGYLRVSTSSGEQLSALDAQGVRVKAEDCDMVLTDVETGRNPLRAQYQSLRQLIDAGVVAEVVATQFSRLGRDSRESDDFVKLCDAKGVTCRTLDDGILTMATPEDLLLTRLKGSLSEGESMRLSRRVRSGLEAGRAMGKPMRKPCWGYRLTSDRKRLEPDPVEFPRAQRFLALLRSLNWRMSTAVREFEEPTPLSSCRAVRSWLLNPTIRGGIAYHQKPNEQG
jgi:DNA invertase Pin-like site-specific DNA recombinase